MGFREVADVFDGVDGIPPAQKLVAVALADRADQDGVCWPSVDELCRRTCQSKSSVLRHLRALEERGVLTIQTRRDRLPDGRWVQRTNVYRLNLPDIRAGVFSQVTPRCQNRPYRGVTRDTRTKDQLNNHPSPQPPNEFGERAGADAPLGGAPGGAPGEGSDSRDLDGIVAGLSPAQRDELRRTLVAERGLKVQVPAFADNSQTHARLVALAREVLPEPMQAMAPSALAQVGEMIAERLNAGWTRAQLSAILRGRELPQHVRTMAALVKARLRDDIPVDAAPPAGTTFGNDSMAPGRWSQTLENGRVITRKDLDCGAIAADFHHARAAGKWKGDDRWEFAAAVGVERYLLA
ncbi:MarR family [Corynebacterium kutscheri]|uniref:MarR family n=2 Tax=Corynebacterium kutscheri TaxID=35755 RepID=A0AB38VQY8_9CORY|nr:MarR family [Corynebacterium kutscheri]VEH82236.1 MarR family [Corynebacterium kutscheri]